MRVGGDEIGCEFELVCEGSLFHSSCFAFVACF